MKVLPEDKVFYQQIAEHIDAWMNAARVAAALATSPLSQDKLLLETSKHKQGRAFQLQKATIP